MRAHPLFVLLSASLVASACATPPPAAAPVPRAVAEWSVPSLAPPAPVSAREYAERRAALTRSMENGVLVVWGSPEPENDYATFTQNPAFRYLTGITEPGAALVIARTPAGVREMLFVLPRNPAREVYEGERISTERAQALTGIATRTVEQLDAAVDSLLASGGVLYSVSPLAYDAGDNGTLRHDQQLTQRIAQRHPGVRTASLDREIRALRAVKSPAELDLIRRAAYITAVAQRAAMRSAEPGMNEFELQALIEYTFRRNGAERPSFATIVGSGPNSTTLHYRAADRFTEPGEMVVMDIGASYRGYAADVTRSIPINGRFSPEQRAIYEVVLAAQKAAEREARAGVSWAALSDASQRTVAEGLARLGLIESPDATYECAPSRQCPQWRLFYLHGLGHGIGLDVHDPDVGVPGAGPAREPLRVGSAFTIEPGIYVRHNVLDFLPDTPANRALIQRLRPVVERYRNIGVRIEDDYIATAEGAERISAGAPREIAEIEALMAEPGPGNQERLGEVVEWYKG